MIQVNAMGDACPIPVVKTKNAIRELGGAGTVVTLVDNEIAVQNLQKMARQKGYGVQAEKLGEGRYQVTMTVGPEAALPARDEPTACPVKPAGEKNTVVVIRSKTMGVGSEELGAALMKGFLYALGQQDHAPGTAVIDQLTERTALAAPASPAPSAAPSPAPSAAPAAAPRKAQPKPASTGNPGKEKQPTK